MTATGTGSGRPAIAPAPAWRGVALPTEHGGWSLTAEPAVLGLLVAWSWSGLALATAALLAFVARTPLKIVLVDWHRGRWLERTRLAATIGAVELSLLGTLAVLAWWGTDQRFWIPLVLAAPLIAVELWYDMRSRSRRLLPELAGTVGIGSVAAAVTLAGGASTETAAGLWCVVSARAVASIPYVRCQILRFKSRPASFWHSDVAQVVAVGIAAMGWALDAVPAAAVIVIVVVAAVNVLDLRLPARRAAIIGVQQLVVGIIVIGVTALAVVA